MSPLLCREVCFRALGDASPRLERPDDAQRARLAHELDALVFAVETNNLAPTMLLDGDRPKDFSAVPILQYQGALESRGCGSFSELLDEFYLRRDKAEAMRRRSQELTHQVRTLRDRTAKKLAIQQSDLLRCADREALRQKADLIKANLYRIRKGDRAVTVQDYYAEGCPDVTIELDPRKSPQENAAALYKSYRKAKTAEQHLTGLIAEASRNLDYLNSVLDELARAESERDLADIRAELRATGYLRQPRNAKKEKTAQRAPLSFVSSTGYEILVGRSNTQNDELTHRTARRTDLWAACAEGARLPRYHPRPRYDAGTIRRSPRRRALPCTIRRLAAAERRRWITPWRALCASRPARCRAWCSTRTIRPAWPRATRRSWSVCARDKAAKSSPAGGAFSVSLAVYCSNFSRTGWTVDGCGKLRYAFGGNVGSIRRCRRL